MSCCFGAIEDGCDEGIVTTGHTGHFYLSAYKQDAQLFKSPQVLIQKHNKKGVYYVEDASILSAAPFCAGGPDDPAPGGNAF